MGRGGGALGQNTPGRMGRGLQGALSPRGNTQEVTTALTLQPAPRLLLHGPGLRGRITCSWRIFPSLECLPHPVSPSLLLKVISSETLPPPRGPVLEMSYTFPGECWPQGARCTYSHDPLGICASLT